MINNRTLAIAAVLALTVPAVGAAAPVYFNPLTEQLVEGHTVFAVLEVVDKTTRERNHFAAAVAVLVRENVQIRELQRFPGVLWFNDQYLVNPYDSDKNAKQPRYPCGGAVLAVNQNDPDPRTMLLGQSTANVNGGEGANRTVTANGPSWTTNDDKLSDGAYGNDYAWLGGTSATVDPANETVAVTGYSDVPTTFNYLESYLITDPNDHMWQIDVYEGSTRVYLNDLSQADGQTFKVWVVNMLGSPVFTPDNGGNCPPYSDITDLVYEPFSADLDGDGVADASHPGLACGQKTAYDRGEDTGTNQYSDDGFAGTPKSPNTDNQRAPRPGNRVTGGAYADDPCGGGSADNHGYASPSSNGYCYNGVENTGQCDAGSELPTKPVRFYNALLYFKLEHLTAAGTPRDHADGSTDTNGCQVYTEWACPDSDANGETAGDDDSEGFSHAFHPDPNNGNTVEEAAPCPETYYQPGGERSNHGGSTTADSGVWYEGEARYNGRGYCDEIHATRNIDLYFSGSARPFPPVVPNFVITDLEGSAAPYHCEHTPDYQSDGTVAPIDQPDNADCARDYYDPLN